MSSKVFPVVGIIYLFFAAAGCSGEVTIHPVSYTHLSHERSDPGSTYNETTYADLATERSWDTENGTYGTFRAFYTFG